MASTAVTQRRGKAIKGIISERCDLLFSERRDIKEHETTMQVLKRLGAAGQGIEVLLAENPEKALPSCDFIKLRSLCPLQNLALLEQNSPIAGKRRGAWLDDRSVGPENGFRRYKNPLSPRDLYEALQPPRWQCPGQADADRRLIYIEDIDQDRESALYIFALTQTATLSQMSALKEVLTRHMNFQNSIALQISEQKVNFTFCLHFSYYIVASLAPDERPPHLEWVDSSFSNMSASGPLDNQGFGMYKVRDSVTISGFGYSDYVTYCFADTLVGNEKLDDEGKEQDFFYTSDVTAGVHEDPIASGRESVDTNAPVMDVRDYALIVIDQKTQRALMHWKNVIGMHKDNIKAFEKYAIELPGRKESVERGDDEINKAYQRTREWVAHLAGPHHEISEFVKTLECFVKGDIRFFSVGNNSLERLRNIRECLRRLKTHEETLSSWLKSCDKINNHLVISIQLEANKSLKLSGIAAKVSFKILTPVALSIGFLSMNEKALPFELSFRVFCITPIILFILVHVTIWICSCLEKRPGWWKRIPAHLQEFLAPSGSVIERRGSWIWRSSASETTTHEADNGVELQLRPPERVLNRQPEVRGSLV